MTSVNQAARTGKGRIMANFREIPAPTRAIVSEKVTLLKEAGINGAYVLGNTSEAICQIGVGLNLVGMVLLWGFNPVAADFEAGTDVTNVAESGLIDFEQLKSFWDLL